MTWRNYCCLWLLIEVQVCVSRGDGRPHAGRKKVRRGVDTIRSVESVTSWVRFALSLPALLIIRWSGLIGG